MGGTDKSILENSYTVNLLLLSFYTTTLAKRTDSAYFSIQTLASGLVTNIRLDSR